MTHQEPERLQETRSQSNKKHETTSSLRHPLSLRSASSIGRSQSNNRRTATRNPNTCQGKAYTLDTKIQACRLNLNVSKLEATDSRLQANSCAEASGSQAFSTPDCLIRLLSFSGASFRKSRTPRFPPSIAATLAWRRQAYSRCPRWESG